MDLLTILASVGSGGLTGLLGSGITAYSSYKNKQLDLSHRENMREYDLQALDKEIERDIHITEVEATTTREVSSDDLMEASIKAAKLDSKDAQDNWLWILIEGWRRLRQTYIG
jgi:hypothetical protein